jgi:hypothetical protein
MTKTTRREEVRKVRLFFFVFRLASRRAPRVRAQSGHVVDEDTHKFGFPSDFHVIEKTVKPPTHLARGPTRRETRVLFLFFPLGFALPETRFRNRTETTQKRSLRR